MRARGVVLALVAALAMPGCATARHAAVISEGAFSAAVFAVDRAEFNACAQRALSAELCAALNPKIKQATANATSIAEALRATPSTMTISVQIPGLIENLTDLEAMLAPLAEGPLKSDLLDKTRLAIHHTLLVLQAVTGGK